MTTDTQLENCADCTHVQYPPRGFCERCLSPNVAESPVSGSGQVLSWTNLHISLEPTLRPHLPITIASVRLDAGPIVITYLVGQPVAGQSVRIGSIVDPLGRSVLVARSDDNTATAESLF